MAWNWNGRDRLWCYGIYRSGNFSRRNGRCVLLEWMRSRRLVRSRLHSSNPRVVTADGARHDLHLVSVVRIGKVVGKWPGLSSLCYDAGLIKTKARTARVKLCSIAVADVAKKVRLP
jgi:hypothetical protein